MSDYPDFSQYHYQVEKELGNNRAGGRVTYLAIDNQTNQLVVIKQFQFARLGASWADYDAYEREIQLLKELDHPGIPRYLSSFQTADGFCMVQEYKRATSLGEPRSFTPDTIRQVAIAALEVLIYLQNRIPPIIHRDIKPENILVDEAGNVFLVDFGFARVGEGEVGVSSVVKGTLGFMPPEQLFNRQLTEASDLYGLGMTLICLLTNTKSDRIGDLVDISYRVSFKHLVPKLNTHWLNWLEKMVEPRLKDRFPNAVKALESIPTSPLRPPEAQFSQSSIELAAGYLGEWLTEAIVITNPIPETTLEGKWQIEPHPHDPASNLYTWIAVTPESFTANQVKCQVTVDTHKLIAGKTYHRRLLLQTNSLNKTYPLDLKLKTAAISKQSHRIPFSILSLMCLGLVVLSWFLTKVVVDIGAIADSLTMTGVGTALGAAIGCELAAWLLRSANSRIGATASTVIALVLGVGALLQGLTGSMGTAGAAIVISAGVGGVGGAIAGLGVGVTVERLAAQGIQAGLAIVASLLVATLGISLGIGFAASSLNPFLLTLLVTSSLATLALILHFQLRRMQLLFSHRSSERYAIKP
jgi:serine/threonine protein kinase